MINGLMARADWQRARLLPVAIIPGGSGNAMARSLGLVDPLAATLAVVKGHTRPLDLLSIRQVGRPTQYNSIRARSFGLDLRLGLGARARG